MRLCARGALLVNAIVTLPALAVSELFVNFSCPLGSAAMARPVAAVDGGVAVDAVVAGAAAVDV
jgi:hypothetical protein